MRRRSSLLLVLVAVASAGLLAGCGGSSATAPPPLDDLTAVTAASKAATSFAFDLRISQSALGQDLSISADGAYDTAAERGRMSVDLSALAKLLSGFGQAFGAKPDDIPAEFDDPDAWKLDVVQDGTQVFLRFPLLADQLDGKEWVGGDVTEIAKSTGTDLGQLGSFAASDPRAALDALEAVSGGLESVGREEVRGVETTRYRAVLDPSQVVSDAADSEDAQDLLSGLREALAQVELDTIPIDVWVDDEGLLRKYAIDVTLTEGGQEMTMSVILELFGYGDPVDVDLPAPADVADVATLKPQP